jgi:hypothetical protein
MKIISIDKGDKRTIIIWFMDDVNFVKAVVTDDDNVDVDITVPIAKYGSYAVFAATMGKFNPYTEFVDEPIEVDDLDFEKLVDVCNELEKKDREALKTLEKQKE